MEPEKTPLTTQESLDLITDMIQQAKGNVQGNSIYFLVWGWVIVVANLGHYAILTLTDFKHPYVAWLLAVPVYIFTLIYGMRSKKVHVRTHLDKIHSSLWLGFAICIPVAILFGRQINFQINAVILLLAALPTYVSGVGLNFKPLVWGGIIFWIASIACFMVPTIYQYPIMAVAIGVGYLIPGYLLRKIE